MSRLLPLLLLLTTSLAVAKEDLLVMDEVNEVPRNASTIVDGGRDDDEPIIEVKRAIEDPVDQNKIEEVKAELDKAVQSLNKTLQSKADETKQAAVGVSKTLEPCTSVDCNNRGTCLGTRKTYLCACQLGYSGRNCEDTICDSARDCNGRGLCFGTTNSLTCLCNLGFSGPRCETPV